MADKGKSVDNAKPEGYTFGRPSKYGCEILEQGWEYVNGGWKEIGDTVPILEGLALYLGISYATLNLWRLDEDKKDFLDICDTVMTMQGRGLINNGLTGVFAQPVTKMMLTKHGYSDKVENINPVVEKTVYIERDEKEDMEQNISDVVDD